VEEGEDGEAEIYCETSGGEKSNEDQKLNFAKPEL
jgi:hypothetical protein